MTVPAVIACPEFCDIECLFCENNPIIDCSAVAEYPELLCDSSGAVENCAEICDENCLPTQSPTLAPTKSPTKSPTRPPTPLPTPGPTNAFMPPPCVNDERFQFECWTVGLNLELCKENVTVVINGNSVTSPAVTACSEFCDIDCLYCQNDPLIDCTVVADNPQLCSSSGAMESCAEICDETCIPTQSPTRK